MKIKRFHRKSTPAKRSAARAKRAFAAVLSLLCAVMLAACSDIVKTEPLYVYGFALDRDASGILLYVLAESAGNGSAQSADNAGSAFAGSSDSAVSAASSASGSSGGFTLLTFGGKTPAAAFDAFFAAYEDVYTGTVKIYLLGENLDAAALTAFRLYLMDSARLPLKRDGLRSEDPYRDFTACAALEREAFESLYEHKGENVLRVCA
ncbi:MAG: hypothetical protein ACI4RV_02595 [Eubacteriales bacterium]